MGQRQKHTTVKKTNILYIAYVLIGALVGASNEPNGEKQAVVQRSLTVLSQRVGDDIARCIAPLLSMCYRTATPPGSRRHLSGPAP